MAVSNNISTGAAVKLAIDGLNGYSIRNTSVSGARGGRDLNCPGASADYAVGHFLNLAPLQSGYVVRMFDVGSNCQ